MGNLERVDRCLQRQWHGIRQASDEEAEATNKSPGSRLSYRLEGTPGLLEGKTILDAGCEGGNKTISLSESTKAKIVIGLDGSPTASKAADNLAKTLEVTNVGSVQGYMGYAQEIMT